MMTVTMILIIFLHHRSSACIQIENRIKTPNAAVGKTGYKRENVDTWNPWLENPRLARDNYLWCWNREKSLPSIVPRFEPGTSRTQVTSVTGYSNLRSHRFSPHTDVSCLCMMPSCRSRLHCWHFRHLHGKFIYGAPKRRECSLHIYCAIIHKQNPH
jgi:hypothetical protein